MRWWWVDGPSERARPVTSGRMTTSTRFRSPAERSRPGLYSRPAAGRLLSGSEGRGARSSGRASTTSTPRWRNRSETAERTELERAAVSLRLRQRGVEVVDALPDDLAPRLADCYLALKAAGRL